MQTLNIPHLRGEHIDLCVLRTDEEAINLYTKWMNDENISIWIHHNDTLDYYNNELEWATQKRNRNENYWCIIEKETGNLIGTCDCNGVRNVSIGICIGEFNGRNKGYGTEAIKLMLKFIFEEKNAHRAQLRVVADNLRAYNCYKKLGFTEYGRERESCYYHGKYVDLIEMDMLKKEYFEKYPLEHNNEIEKLSKL